MCYDIKTNLEAQLSRANRKGDLQAIKEIKEKLVPWTDLPIYHTTGFNHPKFINLYRPFALVPRSFNLGFGSTFGKRQRTVNRIME